MLSVGYNGPAAGLDNDSCTNEVGNCGCAHAEINALVKLRSNTPAILYSTVQPCFNCANAIINAGSIIGVIFRAACRHGNGPILRLHEANIITEHFEDIQNPTNPEWVEEYLTKRWKNATL